MFAAGCGSNYFDQNGGTRHCRLHVCNYRSPCDNLRGRIRVLGACCALAAPRGFGARQSGVCHNRLIVAAVLASRGPRLDGYRLSGAPPGALASGQQSRGGEKGGVRCRVRCRRGRKRHRHLFNW